MKKTIIILLAILMFSKTYACTCLENFTLREEIENSEFIATGKVISFERYTIGYKLAYTHNTDGSLRIPIEFDRQSLSKYKVLITRIYKGDLNSDTLIILTGEGGGDCGFHFEIDKNYTIFGNRNSYYDLANSKDYQVEGANIVWTNDCTMTAEIDSFITKKLNEEFKTKVNHKVYWEEAKIDTTKLKNLISEIVQTKKTEPNQLVLKVNILENGKMEVEDLNFMDKELNDKAKEVLLSDIQKSVAKFIVIPRKINGISKKSRVLIEL